MSPQERDRAAEYIAANEQAEQAAAIVRALEKRADEKLHKFEEAGLGKAPFRVVGYRYDVGPKVISVKGGVTHTAGSPGQPMGVCKYCGEGIAHVFIIRSADGNEFDVGSTCVGKTGDAGMKKAVNRKVNALRREAREKKEMAKIAEGREWCAARRDEMTKLPHPSFDGKTLADYYDWMMERAGRSGMLRAIKTVQKALGK